LHLLQPEDLAERTNDDQQQNPDADLRQGLGRSMTQTSAKSTSKMPAVATFHTSERTRKTPAA
jgi:hypothetical protein